MWFRRRRRTAPTPSAHVDAMTDLRDKDRVIDNLLATADGLVAELRVSLAQVAADVRRSAGEGDDDGG